VESISQTIGISPQCHKSSKSSQSSPNGKVTTVVVFLLEGTQFKITEILA